MSFNKLHINNLTLKLLVLLILPLSSFNQNLVPNHSFENYSTCPWTSANFSYTNNWYVVCNTPDLMHSCDTSDNVSVPINFLGYQKAFDGEGYANIYLFGGMAPGVDYREAIGVQLTESLESGHKYCIDFYISKADLCSNAVSTIGTYFSDSAIVLGLNCSPLFSLTPQFETDWYTILTDSLNWRHI